VSWIGYFYMHLSEYSVIHDKMDVLMQQVVDGSVKLCIDHSIPQSIIYERIRQALMDKVSNLPKQKVLYNACYGGFGFSKEFNAFLLKDAELRDSVSTRDYDKRHVAIPYIIPFADDVINKTSSTYPYLRDMLYIIQKYNINKLFADVNHIIKTENDLQLMAKNVQSLREYLQSNPTVPEKPMPISHWVLMFIKTNFLRYHPTDIKHLLAQYDEGVLQKEYYQMMISTHPSKRSAPSIPSNSKQRKTCMLAPDCKRKKVS
jgi:hypothetical protein